MTGQLTIVATSDLHGNLPRPSRVPKGDVLVIAGDLCGGRTAEQQLAWLRSTFRPWAEQVPYRHIVVVWGNHDWVGQSGLLLPAISTVTWLQDAAIVLEGVTFWGSPWSLPFFNWAFMKPDDQLAHVWDQIPVDTDVVIVHGPPFGVGDRNLSGTHCGSQTLLDRLRVVRPQLALFGHIHEAFGQVPAYGGLWANVSALDSDYKWANNFQVFTVQKREGHGE